MSSQRGFPPFWNNEEHSLQKCSKFIQIGLWLPEKLKRRSNGISRYTQAPQNFQKVLPWIWAALELCAREKGEAQKCEYGLFPNCRQNFLDLSFLQNIHGKIFATYCTWEVKITFKKVFRACLTFFWICSRTFGEHVFMWLHSTHHPYGPHPKPPLLFIQFYPTELDHHRSFYHHHYVHPSNGVAMGSWKSEFFIFEKRIYLEYLDTD